jgi:hypothetical protein
MMCIESVRCCFLSSGLSVVTNSLCLTPSFFRFLPSFYALCTSFHVIWISFISLRPLLLLPSKLFVLSYDKDGENMTPFKGKQKSFFKRFVPGNFPGVNRLKLKKENHRIEGTARNDKQIRHKSSLKFWNEGVLRSWCKYFRYIHCFITVM